MNKPLFDYKGTFPIDSLTESIKRIALCLYLSNGFKVEYTISALLSALAAAIGRKLVLHVKGTWYASCALFFLVAGIRGQNKTHPVNFAYGALTDRDIQRMKEYRPKKREYNQNKHLYEKGKLEEEPIEPILERTLLSDYTPESLRSILYNNPVGVSIVIDEIRSLIKYAGRYGGQNSIIEDLLSAYSGQPLRSARETKDPIAVEHPFVCLIGTIQIELLSTFLSQENIYNGFGDRFLIAYPDNMDIPLWTEDDDDSMALNCKAEWDAIINKTLTIPFTTIDDGHDVQPKILEFTPEAKHYLFEWVNVGIEETNKQTDLVLKNVRVTKDNDNLCRLALIIQVLRWATEGASLDEVDIQSVKTAIELTKYYQNTYKLALRGSIDDYDMLEAWLSLLNEEFTTKEALDAGCVVGIPRRSVFSYFNKLRTLTPPKITKIAHGRYKKLD